MVDNKISTLQLCRGRKRAFTSDIIKLHTIVLPAVHRLLLVSPGHGCINALSGFWFRYDATNWIVLCSLITKTISRSDFTRPRSAGTIHGDNEEISQGNLRPETAAAHQMRPGRGILSAIIECRFGCGLKKITCQLSIGHRCLDRLRSHYPDYIDLRKMV